VTNTWDVLGRLLKGAFPDGTYVTNVYTNLDLIIRYDRLGFTNGYAYDRFRHLIRHTNANAKVATYQYCICGLLDAIIDPLNTTTSLFYDNAGRRTAILYDTGKSVTNNYDLLGQVTSVADSGGVA